jgi:hypothetical protein
MTIEELIKELQEIKNTYDGKIKVILDTESDPGVYHTYEKISVTADKDNDEIVISIEGNLSY